MSRPNNVTELAQRLRNKKTLNRMFAAMAMAAAALLLSACSSDADVASRNISKSADNFEVLRRVVFYNGITDSYMLSIEGLCSAGNHDRSGVLTITCKTAPGVYKKHFLGLSDNVTYFIEQLEPLPVGTSHYVVNFKPSAILPDIHLR